jgi:uncharacterized protein
MAPSVCEEIFSVPLEQPGIFLIYAPLRKAAFVGNAATVDFLARLRGGAVEGDKDPDGSLVEFLRRLQIVDGPAVNYPVTPFSGLPEPTAVTLFLTTACNLRCTYCYASAGDTPVKHMPLEVAERGIDFVASNAARKQLESFDVTYHGGGEPSVQWTVMCRSRDYAAAKAASLGLKLNTYAATNGVLDDHQIDWMVANLTGLSISMDGSPEVHDKHRLNILGQGSSHRVMHTLRRLDATGFLYGLRVTVTADQISRLPDSVEFICSQFNPSRIQVEPAYQLGRWREAPSAETQQFIEAYRQAQFRAKRFGKEISYSAARAGTLTSHFCGITQDTFALSPDGNVSACYEVFSEENRWANTFFYGAPDDTQGYRFNLPILSHLRNQTVDNREYCRGCFAKWSCAGDCYHKSLNATGQLEFTGSDRCHITRELTKDQVLEAIRRSGGLYWHEADYPAAHHQAANQGKEVFA